MATQNLLLTIIAHKSYMAREKKVNIKIEVEFDDLPDLCDFLNSSFSGNTAWDECELLNSLGKKIN